MPEHVRVREIDDDGFDSLYPKYSGRSDVQHPKRAVDRLNIVLGRA